MNENEILKFRKSLANFSLEDLKEEQKKIQDQISKMILDSELIIKAAIVDTLIKEKEKNNG